MEIMYLRNSDIPQYLEDGVVDIAIVGENLLIEKQKDIRIVEKLGFSKCRVSIAVPKEIETDDLTYFQGKKIATSYPNTLKKFLEKRELHQIFTSFPDLWKLHLISALQMGSVIL